MSFTQPPPVPPWFFFTYFLYTITIKLPDMQNALRKAWHVVVAKSCYVVIIVIISCVTSDALCVVITEILKYGWV